MSSPQEQRVEKAEADFFHALIPEIQSRIATMEQRDRKSDEYRSAQNQLESLLGAAVPVGRYLATDLVHSLVRHWNPDLSSIGLDAAKSLPADTTFSILTAVANSPRGYLLSRAVYSLRPVCGDLATAWLVDAVCSDTPRSDEIRRQAAEALRGAKTIDSGRLLAVLQDQSVSEHLRRLLIPTLASQPDPDNAIQQAIIQLWDREPNLRYELEYSFFHTADVGVIDRIKAHGTSGGLARMRGPEVARSLHGFASNQGTNPKGFVEAVEALSNLGSSQDVPFLRGLLVETLDLDNKTSIVEALGKLMGPQAMDLLVETWREVKEQRDRADIGTLSDFDFPCKHSIFLFSRSVSRLTRWFHNSKNDYLQVPIPIHIPGQSLGRVAFTNTLRFGTKQGRSCSCRHPHGNEPFNMSATTEPSSAVKDEPLKRFLSKRVKRVIAGTATTAVLLGFGPGIYNAFSPYVGVGPRLTNSLSDRQRKDKTIAELGDSLGAGTGNGTYAWRTAQLRPRGNRCLQAADRSFGDPILSRFNQLNLACTTTTSDEFIKPNKFGDPPQLQQLHEYIANPDSPRLAAVIVSAGANESGNGWAGIIESCLVFHPHTCEQQIGPEFTNAMQTLRATLIRDVALVKQTAEVTPIYLQTYPEVIGAKACGLIGQSDLEPLRRGIEMVNNVIRKVAKTTGIGVIEGANAVKGHEMCSTDPWVNGFDAIGHSPIGYVWEHLIDAAGFGGPNYVPFHPNSEGWNSLARIEGATVGAGLGLK